MLPALAGVGVGSAADSRAALFLFLEGVSPTMNRLTLPAWLRSDARLAGAAVFSALASSCAEGRS